MGYRKKLFRAKNVNEQIEELPQLESVDEMLLDGYSVRALADMIQQEWRQLLDFKPGTIVTNLYLRRRRLQELNGERTKPVVENACEDYRRVISKYARGRYDKAVAGVERMIELEAMYLAQRDRIDWLLEQERNSGMKMQGVAKQFLVATNTLLAHLKCEMAAFGTGDKANEAVMSFDRYSENTAKALANPESRRRVVSIIERIQRNAKAVPTCDAPVSCGPGIDATRVEIDVPGQPVSLAVKVLDES